MRTLALVFALAAAPALARDSHAHAPAGPAPDAVVADLLAGNERFASGKSQAHPLDPARRAELANGQHPKAVVLTCSDSRVPPELLFDQGVGDLFVIRVAGNVAAPAEVGSAEYAVEHLGARVLVVLGHSHCGAVKATAEASTPAAAGPNLGAIVEEIQPAVQHVRAEHAGDLREAEQENVRRAAERIESRSPSLRKLIQSGELKVVPALYDLASGRVELEKRTCDARAEVRKPQTR